MTAVEPDPLVPPLFPDLVTAAWQRVASSPAFLELLEPRVLYPDKPGIPAYPLVGSESNGTPWLFQGLDPEGRPFRDPEGSSTSVVVLSERSDWAAANAHNTADFPALQMLIYTDSTRHEDGSLAVRDADRKCKHIFKILDRLFHCPQNRVEDRKWPYLEGGVERVFHVHSTLRGTLFDLDMVPGTQDLTVRAEARYNVITD